MVVLTRFHILTLAFALLLLISGASFAAQKSHHSSSLHSQSAVVKNHRITTSRADVRAYRRGYYDGYYGGYSSGYQSSLDSY
jgi:hypothetical protein